MKFFHLPVERCNNSEPILAPTTNWWETGVTFNAAVFYLQRSPQNEPLMRTLLPMLRPDHPDLVQGVVAVHYRARPEVDPGTDFVRSFIGLALFTPDLKLLYRYQEPVLYPSPEAHGFDALGVEDPRITYLDGTFYMVYCGVASDPIHTWRARLCLAASKDLLHWEKLGPMPGNIHDTNNKDGVLFPDVMDGHYLLLHRPFWEGLPQSDFAIHLAVSHSIRGPWRDVGVVLRAFPNPGFQASWVGAGSVPVPLGDRRYAVIYHTGNYRNQVDREYDLDAAVFDFSRFDPSNPASLVTARLEHLMTPETPAELRSYSALQVGNVLFACGSYEYKDHLYIIYGGSDTYTLAARVKMSDLKAVLDGVDLKNPFFQEE